jgi:hypothetical protein
MIDDIVNKALVSRTHIIQHQSAKGTSSCGGPNHWSTVEQDEPYKRNIQEKNASGAKITNSSCLVVIVADLEHRAGPFKFDLMIVVVEAEGVSNGCRGKVLTNIANLSTIGAHERGRIRCYPHKPLHQWDLHICDLSALVLDLYPMDEGPKS